MAEATTERYPAMQVKRAELTPGAPPSAHQQQYLFYTAGLGHHPAGGPGGGHLYLGDKVG